MDLKVFANRSKTEQHMQTLKIQNSIRCVRMQCADRANDERRHGEWRMVMCNGSYRILQNQCTTKWPNIIFDYKFIFAATCHNIYYGSVSGRNTAPPTRSRFAHSHTHTETHIHLHFVCLCVSACICIEAVNCETIIYLKIDTENSIGSFHRLASGTKWCSGISPLSARLKWN